MVEINLYTSMNVYILERTNNKWQEEPKKKPSTPGKPFSWLRWIHFAKKAIRARRFDEIAKNQSHQRRGLLAF